MRAISSRYELWSALFGPFFAGAMIMCICGWTLLVDLPLRAVARLVSNLNGRLG